MESKIIYRIENPEDKDGMWYTKNGILRKKIHQIYDVLDLYHNSLSAWL